MVDGAPTVLVVEDDASTRAGLTALLEAEGYSVLGAENGRQALDLLASGDPPRLILLDLMMPVMDGWQFLVQQRLAAASAPQPPVVLLSGLAFIDGVTGVADFLRKPIEPKAVLACVQRFCAPR
jgi:CheY-like chemotaxis protein